jgi:3-deoxy-7-phosphoheptulonate synthase
LSFLTFSDTGNFADLHYPANWNFSHIRNATLRRDYESITQRLVDSLDFMRVIGADPVDPHNSTTRGPGSETTRTVDFFVSHEGLHLEYESCLTRKVNEERKAGRSESHYNLGTHFLWIGDRTRALDGAHVEYFRGIRNPIGVKVGPSMQPDELVKLLAILDPNKEPGRITLITRFGASKVLACSHG